MCTYVCYMHVLNVQVLECVFKYVHMYVHICICSFFFQKKKTFFIPSSADCGNSGSSSGYLRATAPMHFAHDARTVMSSVFNSRSMSGGSVFEPIMPKHCVTTHTHTHTHTHTASPAIRHWANEGRGGGRMPAQPRRRDGASDSVSSPCH